MYQPDMYFPRFAQKQHVYMCNSSSFSIFESFEESGHSNLVFHNDSWQAIWWDWTTWATCLHDQVQNSHKFLRHSTYVITGYTSTGFFKLCASLLTHVVSTWRFLTSTWYWTLIAIVPFVCVFNNFEGCFASVRPVAPRRVIHPKRFAYGRSHGCFFQSSPGAGHGGSPMVVLRANTPIRPHPFYAVHLGMSNVRLFIQLGRSTRVFREYKFPTPVKLLHSLKIFNKGLILPPPLNFTFIEDLQ